MTTVRIDVRQIEGLADRLATITGEALGGIAVRAVNEVAVRFTDDSRARITERVNLTPEYVKSKTDMKLAESPADPTAVVTVAGALTTLGHYGPVTYFAPEGGVRRANGWRAAGLNAGVGLEVGRGHPFFAPQWFTMALRGQGGALGVFVRGDPNYRGKARHLYGPSPYALFGRQIDHHSDELRADLERTAVQRIADALEV